MGFKWTLRDTMGVSIHEEKPLSTSIDLKEDDEYTRCIAELLKDHPQIAFACHPVITHGKVYVILAQDGPYTHTAWTTTQELPADLEEFHGEAMSMIERCLATRDEWKLFRG